MRCKACDVILEGNELLRKDRATGKHLDLCGTCSAHSDDALYRPDEAEDFGAEEFIEEMIADYGEL